MLSAGTNAAAARLGVAGAVFEHPYPPTEDSLEDPIVWYANPVEVFDQSLRSKGIGSALYGHLSELGYLLMKAEAQQGSPDGRRVPADRLWNRLHPNYDSELEAGFLPVSNVQKNEDTLASLVGHYGIDPNGPVCDLAALLDQRVWGLLNWP